MRRVRRAGVVLASALALSGCTLVSTSSAPTLVDGNSVPLGLLSPTIPFTDYARVLFVSRDIYLVNKAQLVVPVSRLVTSPPSLFDVLHYVPVGPTVSEQLAGTTTQVPSALVVNQATILNGIALVDVSAQLAQIPPVARRIAVAQFLFTAVAMGATKGIELSINQTPFFLTLATGARVALVTPAELAYLKKD
jgi:hypothetical protein